MHKIKLKGSIFIIFALCPLPMPKGGSKKIHMWAKEKEKEKEKEGHKALTSG
jgi:hypothetical protein